VEGCPDGKDDIDGDVLGLDDELGELLGKVEGVSDGFADALGAFEGGKEGLKDEGFDEILGTSEGDHEGIVEGFNWSGHLPFTNSTFLHSFSYLPHTELQNNSPSIFSLHLMFCSVVNQEQSTISEVLESEKVPRTSSGQGLTANNF